MRLSDLTTGQVAVVRKIEGNGASNRRIRELGFVSGQQVKAIKAAPLKDPVEYEIMGYKITLRRSDASMVLVDPVPIPEPVVAAAGTPFLLHPGSAVTGDVSISRGVTEREPDGITVALVGNPNCGKTTIFNFATGSRERVANYSGVTVAAREATMVVGDEHITVVDLPGTYSLTPYSPEELFVSDYLMHNRPDFVINVVDAGNLERNLFLTTQLLETGHRTLIALNMYDEVEDSGRSIDFRLLGELLRTPVLPTIGRDGKGVGELFSMVTELAAEGESGERVAVTYSREIESALDEIVSALGNDDEHLAVPPRFVALKLLQGDADIVNISGSDLPGSAASVAASKRADLERLYGHDAGSEIVYARYGFIKGALSETVIRSTRLESEEERGDPDKILTHPLWGLPIFFGIIWFIFWATFRLGSYPVQWIESGVDGVSQLLAGLLPRSAPASMLVDGVIGGVGGIVVFLPNIIILFLLISLLEDSGYMARTAFLMDRVMHRAGLHGKSFIPLLMGFGCNVPAVMATRTIESKRDRLVTMLIIPFMSCSARLPVYVLFITAFFPSHQSLILFSLYLTGILAALITAIILNRTIFRRSESPFVMELPPYRMPSPKAVRSHTWFKTVHFLRKMGTVILFASVVIWALGYFPRDREIIARYESQLTLDDGDGKNGEIMAAMETELLENSYVSRIGRAIQPVFEPLGFDWKMSVSLLTGVMAKEVVVSTMSVLYRDGGDGAGLVAGLRANAGERGAPRSTYFGFLVFTLLYFPCLGTLTAIRHETSRFRWVLFAGLYPLLFSWGTVWVIRQVSALL